MACEGLLLLSGGSPGGHVSILSSGMAMSRTIFDKMAGSADGGGGGGDRVGVLLLAS